MYDATLEDTLTLRLLTALSAHTLYKLKIMLFLIQDDKNKSSMSIKCLFIVMYRRASLF